MATVLRFEPLAETLSGLNLSTAEQAIAHYKAVDRIRRSWEKRVERAAAQAFDKERLIVRAALLKAALPEQGIVAAELAVNRQQDAWAAFLGQAYLAVGFDFAARFYRGLKAAGAPLEQKADPAEDFVAGLGPIEDRWRTIIHDHLSRESSTKVKQITETTREQIRGRLSEGVAAGEGIPELAKRLDGLYLQQIIPNRSTVIARTEVIAASNLGARAGAVSTGLALDHEWIATPNLRTRPAHLAAHGQTKPMDQAFVVGGQSLMFPGDGSLGASAKNLINCRCTVGFREAAAVAEEQPTFTVGPLPKPKTPQEAIDRLAQRKAELDAETVKMRARERELEEALAVKMQKVADMKPGDVSLEVYRRELDELRATQDALFAYRRQMDTAKAALLDTFRAESIYVDEPITVSRVYLSKFDAARQKRYEDGIDAFEKMVSKGVVPDGKRMGVIAKRGSRAHFYGDTLNLCKYDGVGTVVHEAGHWLEDMSPDVHRKAVAFLKQRTAGETPEKLQKIYKGRGYRRDEMALRDKFRSAYAGKVYAGDRYTEIVSMGVQWMYADPIAFAAEDPEYFTFIWNLLRGL